ncbi:MAG TPA: ferredoxin [Nevskiaceae bacterium]|nr:ferredoxin [Nevskiaceae bacterium]
MSRLKLVIDLDRCAGTGQCVLTAPKVFDQSADNGKVFVLEHVNLAEQEAAVREAVLNCPTRALSVKE